MPMRGAADSLNVSVAAAVLLYEAAPAALGRLIGAAGTPARHTDRDGPFDFVIIGAGPAGEAAAFKARERGATVAIVDRRWFGGSCPHIGCVPSKALLHAAAEHCGEPGGDYSWPRASARRDYMINRPAGAAEPDDASHVRRLEDAGATCYRGTAPDRRPRPGRGPPRRRRSTSCTAANVIVAVGSHLEGAADPGPRRRSEPWTNRDATLARELPRSLLVLGGGPTGCELAQVYARFGVPATVVQSGDRARPDRPSRGTPSRGR